MESSSKLLNTVIGSYSLEEKFYNTETVLSHEHIFQDLSRFHTGLSQSHIFLENYDFLKKNLYSISSNLVLNDLEEMMHEIGLLSKNHKIIIVESTCFSDGKDLLKLKKISEGLGVPIIVGFDIFIDKKTLFLDDQKNKVLINKEAFMKRLSLEFSLGSLEGAKPGFIGPIYLRNFDDELESLKIESYIEFLKKSIEKIPLFIEVSYTEIQEKLEIFENLKNFFSKPGVQDLSSQIVLINIPLIWEILSTETEGFEVCIKLKDEEKIYDIFKLGCLIVFDICYYEDKENYFVEFIKKMIKKGYSKKISISYGNKFKCNLQKYGGPGYLKMIEFQRKFEKIEGFNDIFRDNMLDMLKWKFIEEIKPIAVKKWVCPQCLGEFDDTIDKFRKFDKEFCSIKCLRVGLQNN